MEIDSKVFSSTIIRTQNNVKNNLQDILYIVPASPVIDTLPKKSDCNFVHKTDKYYVPKKKNGIKVRTVQDIRVLFEADINIYLPAELEKQNDILLRKIRLGSSRDEETKETAKNILKSSSPISRSAWQMLININPDEQKFPHQYVHWNGKYIQINGSKGGNCKFIDKYDIGQSKESSLNNFTPKRSNFKKKKALLQNSLNVKFKPGPLTKKVNLDTSYQKYQFGDMELVTLPKPGLEVQPSYGTPLAPGINKFLQDTYLLNCNGVISQKWADFAVSVLGTNNKGVPLQLNEKRNVTFDLDYKCFQHRILMRNDSDIVHHEKVSNVPIQNTEDSVIISEVQCVIDNIIDAVEISLNQNEMFFGEDEIREVTTTNLSSNTNNYLKDKGKRKYGELDRLDVTVIRITESSEHNTKSVCSNDYCALGCVCDSLNYSYGLKSHCGQFDCMFECKCDFSKYELSDSFANESESYPNILPVLVNLDQKMGQTLAKEEQKFHQTVIVTDDKSILLKSQKRNWKASKKYGDFYSNMCLKSNDKTKRTLTVLCTNLRLKNVEPWCMVHNLYKCYCKGRFTKSFFPVIHESINTHNEIPEKIRRIVINIDFTPQELQPDLKNNQKSTLPDCNEVPLDNIDDAKCVRTLPFTARKHGKEYYHSTNKKILEMERNDKTLQKKLTQLMNNEEINGKEEYVAQSINTDTHDIIDLVSDDLLSNVIEQIPQCIEYKDLKQLSSKNLVTWLEANYKQYKERTNQGAIQHSLHPPKVGTMALYPWDFILARYRERKNYFLISNQQPFRIFMAVNVKNKFFDSCTNISDIALSDLDLYPATVKNLLTNATDLKDNFCILCGLTHCWELVGSVTKVNNNKGNLEQESEKGINTSQREKSQSECSSDIEFTPMIAESSSDELNNSLENFTTSPDDQHQTIPITAEQSKWFVMTIENDFTEIRFYKRGFFVKHESIMKAINVAKVSGKTVKLSSQKCSYPQNNPSFGIYAIPSETENYVFIGPYENDEALGIETIKNKTGVKKDQSTRGRWITTNKIDNLKVIDNPLLYMPLSCVDSYNMFSLETDSSGTNASVKQQISDKNTSSSTSKQKSNKVAKGKVVKPIRIRKTNGFFQLAPDGLLKQVPLSNKHNLKYALLLKNNSLGNNDIRSSNMALLNLPLLIRQGLSQHDEVKKTIMRCQKSVAKIAHQEKVPKKASIPIELQEKKVGGGGMLILKPEEINKRSFENELIKQQNTNTQVSTDSKIDMDIETFLERSVIDTKTECYIISDDEDDDNMISNSIKDDMAWKEVWIVCKNIDNLGWIPGRRNSKNGLSFEFPGFKYTDFYNEEEAFSKITQVMARKIYIPKNINLEWQTLEALPDSKIKKKLEAKYLSTDYVMTKKGLQNKRDLMKNMKLLRNADSPSGCTDAGGIAMKDIMKKKDNFINELEKTSNNLEEENSYLWDKTMSKKKEILESFSKASEDLRKELIDQLNNIKSNADDSE